MPHSMGETASCLRYNVLFKYFRLRTVTKDVQMCSQSISAAAGSIIGAATESCLGIQNLVFAFITR